MELKEVGLFEKLNPGDEVRIEIRPRLWGGSALATYLTAYKIDQLQQDPRFIVNGWNYGDDGALTLRVQIRQQGPEVLEAGISPWAIVLVAIGAAALVMVSVTTYKVVTVIADPENPNAVKIASGFQIAAVAVLLFVLLKWRVKA